MDFKEVESFLTNIKSVMSCKIITDHNNISEIPIIWVDMFPAITISIIVNIVATIIILNIFGSKITNYLSDASQEKFLEK